VTAHAENMRSTQKTEDRSVVVADGPVSSGWAILGSNQ
jgi:hypothetical protein